jgi:branched-subunit amino acid transport protein
VSTYLLIIMAIGVGTYLTRLSFVAAFGRSGVPEWLQSPLRYVAPAVLAAIVAPAVISPGGVVDVTTANPKFAAGAVALLVALRTKSVAWTIVVGMAALWLIQAAF